MYIIKNMPYYFQYSSKALNLHLQILTKITFKDIGRADFFLIQKQKGENALKCE